MSNAYGRETKLCDLEKGKKRYEGNKITGGKTRHTVRTQRPLLLIKFHITSIPPSTYSLCRVFRFIVNSKSNLARIATQDTVPRFETEHTGRNCILLACLDSSDTRQVFGMQTREL